MRNAMNKILSFIGLSALLLLGGCAARTSVQDMDIDRLASCSIEDSPFNAADFLKWKETYHGTVASVIDANLRSLSQNTCQENANGLPGPTTELKTLAETLPPWNTPARLTALSEADIGAVLLEYARTYECAMLDYRTFLYPNVMKNDPKKDTMTIGEFQQLQQDRNDLIARELATARTSLNRALAVIGRTNRLRSVLGDVNCFTAASLDLRNQLGLAAEISSCLPRFESANGSLRDFP